MTGPQTNAEAEVTRAADLADRASLARRMHRRQMLRRTVVTCAIIGLVLFLTVFLAPIARHIRTMWMLHAASFNVDWQVDRENWTSGGVTAVNFNSRSWLAHSHEEDPELFSSLLHVETLNLAECPLKEESLAPLARLTELRELNLSRLNQFRPHYDGPDGLDDRCLEPIRGLTRLKTLSLSGNRITDAGLARLTQLTALEYLDLDATDITDGGLAQLESLRNLKAINLASTHVTTEGIRKLQAAMPGLEISTEINPELERGVRNWRNKHR